MQNLYNKKINLNNIILNGSGTLGYGLEFENQIDLNKLGALVLKSTTKFKKEGNKPPTIYFGKNFVINSVGLKNPGVKYVSDIIIPKLEKKYPKLKIIASIWGANINEYLYVAKAFNKFKNIIAFEINISCPNINTKMNFQTDYTLLSELINKLKKATLKTLIIKISPNKNVYSQLKKIEEMNIKYVTASNTYQVKKIVNNKPVVGNIIGGMSGKTIFPKTLKLIKWINKNTLLNIIASGGITSINDIDVCLQNGVIACQIGSMNLKNLNFINNCLDKYKNIK